MMTVVKSHHRGGFGRHWQPLTWSREGAKQMTNTGSPSHGRDSHCVASRGSSTKPTGKITDSDRNNPKEALSNHQEEFGRQAGLCEAIEFLILKDNQAGLGGLEETLKVSQLQIGRR